LCPKERTGDVRVVDEHAAHRLLVVVDHGLHLGHHVVHLRAGHAVDLGRKGFASRRLLRRHGGVSGGAAGDDPTTLGIGRITGRRG